MNRPSKLLLARACSHVGLWMGIEGRNVCVSRSFKAANSGQADQLPALRKLLGPETVPCGPPVPPPPPTTAAAARRWLAAAAASRLPPTSYK